MDAHMVAYWLKEILKTVDRIESVDTARMEDALYIAIGKFLSEEA